MISKQTVALLACLVICAPANATIVRLDIAIGSQPEQPIFLELYDLEAPATVANFLNYIENTAGERRYDGTLLHRSVAGFVVQGGGYAYDPGLGDFGVESAPAIEADPPVPNEFGSSRSNVRGTIAMAKLSGDPDSATSEWFFNLADNALNLDNQNGGFTVFGRVLGDGMTIVDSVAALPTQDFGGPFTNLPVFAYTPGDTVATTNLVTLNRVEIVDAVTPAVLDFGPTAIGSAITDTVTIQNLGVTDYSVDPIDPAALPSPFSLISENCSGAVLASLASCELQVRYQPASAGIDTASFAITTDSSTFNSLNVAVKGTGAPQQASLSLSVSDQLDFGDAGPGDAKQIDVIISNDGIDPLLINLLRFTGTGAEQFSATTNCASIALGESCTETLTFSVISPGIVDASLEIQSSDPNAAQILLPVVATASSDHDGIPDAVEAGASGNGDGNGDGVADAQQDHVTSLPNTFGRYVTLEASPGLQMANVQATPNPSNVTPSTSRGTLSFQQGFFSFDVENVTPGGAATVTLHLPPGYSASTYLKYGNLPGDFFLAPPRWYVFDFDGRTGAQFSGNKVVLNFFDGSRGDDDRSVNGSISDPGGPALLTLEDAGSSGGGCTVSTSRGPLPVDQAVLLLVLLIIRRRRTDTAPTSGA